MEIRHYPAEFPIRFLDQKEKNMFSKRMPTKVKDTWLKCIIRFREADKHYRTIKMIGKTDIVIFQKDNPILCEESTELICGRQLLEQLYMFL